MINLAGHVRADEIARLELARCGVDTVVDDPKVRGEVPTSAKGIIRTAEGREITLTRAWSYWVASGEVPIVVARALYEHPVGRTDIRSGGDAGCRPPETWAVWRTFDNRCVASTKERAEFEQLRGLLRDGYEAGYVFSDDPVALGARHVVESYHIDSELGLYLFVEAVQRKAEMRLRDLLDTAEDDVSFWNDPAEKAGAHRALLSLRKALLS